jgi:molybdopterin synthase catalytic subunit
LKTSAPFWKKEERVDGAGDWVEAKAADDSAAERWS